MAQVIKKIFIVCLLILSIASIAYAQEEGAPPEGAAPPEAPPIEPSPEITAPEAQPEFVAPEGCESPEECASYCSSSPESCMQQMQQNDSVQDAAIEINQEYQQMPKEEKQEFTGPGGCKKPSDCMKYCTDNPQDSQCQEKSKQHKEQETRSPPDKCPEEIQKAGFCADFYASICAGMKYNMKRDFVGKMGKAADYFAGVAQENGFSVDVAPLRNLASEADAKIGEICTADESNFTERVNALMEIANQAKIEPIFKAIISVVQNYFIGLMDAKYEEIQATKSQIESSMGPTGPSPELQQRMETLGNEMQALGQKMETTFKGMETIMEAKPEESPLEREQFIDSQLTLVDKMTKYHAQKLQNLINKFEALGFDTTVLKQVQTEMVQGQEIATLKECIENISMDVNRGDPQTCMAPLEAKAAEWRERSKASIQRQLEEKYVKVLEEIIPAIEEAIATAKTLGIDTQKIEATINKIKTIQAIVTTLSETMGPEREDEAFGVLDDLQASVAELKTEWAALKAEIISRTGTSSCLGTNANCGTYPDCAACDTGYSCVNNACAAAPPNVCAGTNASCGTPGNCAACGPGYSCVSNVCTPPSACAGTAASCGTPGNCVACGTGYSCVNNACVQTIIVNPATVLPSTVLLDNFDGTTKGTGSGALTYKDSQPDLSKAVSLAKGTFIKYSFSPWYKWDGTHSWNRNEASSGVLTEGRIELWVNPQKYSGSDIVTFNWNNAASLPQAGYILHFGFNADGKLSYSVWGGHLDTALVGKTVIPLNEWTHVAVSWGPNGTKLYVNGAVDAFTSGNMWPAFSGTVFAYLNYWGADDLGLVDDFHILKSQVTRWIE